MSQAFQKPPPISTSTSAANNGKNDPNKFNCIAIFLIGKKKQGWDGNFDFGSEIFKLNSVSFLVKNYKNTIKKFLDSSNQDQSTAYTPPHTPTAPKLNFDELLLRIVRQREDGGSIYEFSVSLNYCKIWESRYLRSLELYFARVTPFFSLTTSLFLRSFFSSLRKSVEK